MSAHTPGPWKFEQRGDEYGLWGTMNRLKNQRVFSIKNGVIPMNEDARLIAAAPALLEALKGMLLEWDEPTLACDEARAAIAQAKGI